MGKTKNPKKVEKSAEEELDEHLAKEKKKLKTQTPNKRS